ncbi:hypothetical protein HPB49_013810 [Dermacentor silvarum]|uniref:Uncharacterized protein n=1 Tax=Dermacentor silvarum TaxID=543639 RepID=A0ACB8DJ35_DERSI|nr:hypothetical protein HPB49_013810 [Dermacentor silvarum]
MPNLRNLSLAGRSAPPAEQAQTQQPATSDSRDPLIAVLAATLRALLETTPMDDAAVHVADILTSSVECAAVTVRVGGTDTCVASVYVQPVRQWDSSFVVSLAVHIGGDCVVCMDLVIVSAGLLLLNTGDPTFVRRGVQKSAIDLPLVSESCHYEWRRSRGAQGSDHYPISLNPLVATPSHAHVPRHLEIVEKTLSNLQLGLLSRRTRSGGDSPFAQPFFFYQEIASNTVRSSKTPTQVRHNVVASPADAGVKKRLATTSRIPRRLNVKNVSKIQVTHAVAMAAQQNPAENNTCKGVVRGVDLDFNQHYLTSINVPPRNPRALEVKRIKTTTTVVVLLDGLKMPNYVILGYRADVCPPPKDLICRSRGEPSPSEDHTCNPECALCAEPQQIPVDRARRLTGATLFVQERALPLQKAHAIQGTSCRSTTRNAHWEDPLGRLSRELASPVGDGRHAH